jgi:hypothetical protein
MAPYCHFTTRGPYPSFVGRPLYIAFTTTLIELDSRVTRLEEVVRQDLLVRVDAMNWAIGQTYKNTEATRLDVTGLRVDLTHLETSVRGDIAKLTTDLDLRTSELRHDLGDAEVS